MIGLRDARTALLSAALIFASACGHPALSQGAPPAAKPAPAACQRSAFRVVIDVGHTAEVPGATSARGTPEYAFNLRLAQDVQQALVDAGFEKTALLITNTAPPLGVFERAARANRMAADLFISIHHDSVPENLLETWAYNGQPNHFSDRFTGYAIFVSDENATHAGNLLFGRLLGEELQAFGLHYTPHYTLPLMGNRRRVLLDADAGVYQYNKLIVLQQTHMPAALLEAGSIVNRQEELELAGPKRRVLISAAITAAVNDFCTASLILKRDRLMKSRITGRPAANLPLHPVAAPRIWPARNDPATLTRPRSGCAEMRAC
jgi:N-acetylmuramoyl-L-alanine amidase